jgi:hypothetical protein
MLPLDMSDGRVKDSPSTAQIAFVSKETKRLLTKYEKMYNSQRPVFAGLAGQLLALKSLQCADDFENWLGDLSQLRLRPDLINDIMSAGGEFEDSTIERVINSIIADVVTKSPYPKDVDVYLHKSARKLCRSLYSYIKKRSRYYKKGDGGNKETLSLELIYLKSLLLKYVKETEVTLLVLLEFNEDPVV